MLPYAATTSSSSAAAIASTSRTLFQSRPSNMRPSTSALSQTARAVSRRHLSHSPVSPAPASSSATSSSPSSARTGLRPQPVSQLALPSRSSRLSQPKSFSALLRSSPASCRGASLVLNNRSFSSSSRSTNAADSRVASIAAERGSNGLGRLAAAIAAFSIAANLYLLYGKPTSSSGQDGVYSYSNPSLPHKYGSATDFNKAIDELKAYFAKATGVGWQDNVSQDESELERRGFDENGHRTDSEGMRPSVVVWPRSTEDVVQIVKVSSNFVAPPSFRSPPRPLAFGRC